jgi:hypothetical protein
MAERWVWHCGYDRGRGQDREACFACSTKPVSSEAKARTGLDAHFRRNPWHTRGDYAPNHGYIRKLKRYERWKR